MFNIFKTDKEENNIKTVTETIWEMQRAKLREEIEQRKAEARMRAMYSPHLTTPTDLFFDIEVRTIHQVRHLMTEYNINEEELLALLEQALKVNERIKNEQN